jgi:hypothetical protein
MDFESSIGSSICEAIASGRNEKMNIDTAFL